MNPESGTSSGKVTVALSRDRLYGSWVVAKGESPELVSRSSLILSYLNFK